MVMEKQSCSSACQICVMASDLEVAGAEPVYDSILKEEECTLDVRIGGSCNCGQRLKIDEDDAVYRREEPDGDLSVMCDYLVLGAHDSFGMLIAIELKSAPKSDHAIAQLQAGLDLAAEYYRPGVLAPIPAAYLVARKLRGRLKNLFRAKAVTITFQDADVPIGILDSGERLTV